MRETDLVYSTETGRICPQCSRPQSKCTCKKKKTKAEHREAADGVIRVRREVKGRKGKTVTIISGFQESDLALKGTAAELKQRCGTGGSAKDGMIVIQGDHRETVASELTRQGFTVKLAGE